MNAGAVSFDEHQLPALGEPLDPSRNLFSVHGGGNTAVFIKDAPIVFVGKASVGRKGFVHGEEILQKILGHAVGNAGISVGEHTVHHLGKPLVVIGGIDGNGGGHQKNEEPDRG